MSIDISLNTSKEDFVVRVDVGVCTVAAVVILHSSTKSLSVPGTVQLNFAADEYTV